MSPIPRVFVFCMSGIITSTQTLVALVQHTPLYLEVKLFKVELLLIFLTEILYEAKITNYTYISFQDI